MKRIEECFKILGQIDKEATECSGKRQEQKRVRTLLKRKETKPCDSKYWNKR